MKTILLSFLFLHAIAMNTSAQNGGTITALYISPTNPTITDNITIYADVSFPLSTCNVQSVASFSFGTSIYVGANHCLGAATTICNTTDSLSINPLAAGNYSLVFDLKSAVSSSPCNVDSIPDDTNTLTFTVSDPNSLAEQTANAAFELYPNPNNGSFNIQLEQHAIGQTLSVYSADGRLQYQQKVQLATEPLNLDLDNGMYWVQLSNNNGPLGMRTLIINK